MQVLNVLQNGSETQNPPTQPGTAVVQPPIDEVCRILARVLTRLQSSASTPAGEAS